MFRFLTLFVAAMLPAIVMATSLTWEAPTTRVDGTPLPDTQLGQYQICVGDLNGDECPSPITAPASATEYNIDSILADYQEYTFRIRVSDLDGVYSVWSDPVVGKKVAPPEAPVLQLSPN